MDRKALYDTIYGPAKTDPQAVIFRLSDGRWACRMQDIPEDVAAKIRELMDQLTPHKPPSP